MSTQISYFAQRVILFCALFFTVSLAYSNDPYNPIYPKGWTDREEARVKRIAKELETTRSASTVLRHFRELEGMGRVARFAAPSMIVAIEKHHSKVSDKGWAILKNPKFMGEAVYPSMLYQKDHPNKYVRNLAGGTDGFSKADIQTYIIGLDDPDPNMRKKCMRSLWLLGEDAYIAKDRIYEAVLKDAENVLFGTYALAAIDAETELKKLNELGQQRMSQDEQDKYGKDLALQSDLGLMQVYRKRLTSPNTSAYYKETAAEELVRFEYLAEDDIHALIAGIKDDEASVRSACVNTMNVAMDARPKIVVEALAADILKDKAPSNPSAFMLRKYGERAVPILTEMLEDVNADRRKLGIKCLNILGKEGAAAAEKISEIANNDLDPEVKELAAKVLVSVGQGHEDAVELEMPSTTISNYVVTSEGKARWLSFKAETSWSAGFTFGSLPSELPPRAVRLGLYDASKKQLEKKYVSDSFIDLEPGSYFLKIFREDGSSAEVGIPFKIDFVEE